jgi:hypothetical protein
VKQSELIDDYDKDLYEDVDERAQYLYMELESTNTFRDIDIEAMLENTTMEQFMHGLYTA